MVVDPFCGTGTTALAAEQLGRRWLAAEIDPQYAQAAPERFRTGK
jgi:DNA modification methylase